MSVRFPRQSIRVFRAKVLGFADFVFLFTVLFTLGDLRSSRLHLRLPNSIMDFAVFLNTNLGTRLAISVQYNDTIRDLKGRIMVEHANIFPNIRLLDVLAVKVEINGTSYHLSDLTMVRNVFEGSTRDRFLHVDLTHMVDNITLPVTLPMIKGSQREVPDTDKLNSVQILCENDIVGKKSMDKKRKKKSSIHIHQTVDKFDSETHFDVTSLGKIWIADEACNQVDKADVRKSLSTKNGEHEFQIERSNILEVRETAGNPEKKVNEVPLPKVATPSKHVQDLRDVDHAEGSKSAAEQGNLAEYFSSQEGNLKLKRKRHKKISNLHLQDSSTISANVECQSVPFMGETPARDFESKERQRKSVYDGDVQNCNFGQEKTSLSATEKILIHFNNVLEDEPQEVNGNISPKGSSSTPFGNGHVNQSSMDDQGEIKSAVHSGKSKQCHRNATATSTSGPHVGSKITRRGVQFPSAPRSRPAEAKLMAIFRNSRHYRKALLQLLSPILAEGDSLRNSSS